MNLGYAYGILGSRSSLSRNFLDTHTGNYFVYCCILVSSTMPLCISVWFKNFGMLILVLKKFQYLQTYALIVTHWNVSRTWAVRYNPEYDGLILVCSLSFSGHVDFVEETKNLALHALLNWSFSDKNMLLQSSGTDSTVNLWLASPSSKDGSISER